MVDVKISIEAAHKVEAGALVIYLFEGNRDYGTGTAAINSALGGHLDELIDGGDFTGKAGQTAVLYPRGAISAKRVVVVGLGKQDAFSPDALRRAVAVGLKKARELKAQTAATVLAGTGAGGLSVAQSAQALAEGAIMGLYNYRGQKTGENETGEISTLQILATDSEQDSAQQGMMTGVVVADGACLARELVNLPPNICTPDYLAARAEELAQGHGMRFSALGKQQIAALKMGAFLGVSQGSDTPPRFIILEHNADRADEMDTVVLVGKGITFDTGGYSLKTSDGMVGMKADMGGAAAVISAMGIVARLNIPLHVVGLVPAVDNMISGHAYRPQDVVTASNGKTIEIISTDAEGRLILADALAYAGRYNPSAVVDIATLTGSCVIALGKLAGGLFVTDDGLRDSLLDAAGTTGERLWPLPLYAEYGKLIESDTADVKNVGGRHGGASIGAVFLKNFVDYPVWAHIDVAGVMTDIPDVPYIPPKGGSGYGARLLAKFVQQWADSNTSGE